MYSTFVFHHTVSVQVVLAQPEFTLIPDHDVVASGFLVELSNKDIVTSFDEEVFAADFSVDFAPAAIL